jgi:cytidylate kinase
MAIITISRGTFAGGEKVAQLLAEKLGYSAVSREQLYQKVKEWYSYDIETIAELLEQAPTSRVASISDRQSRISIGERRRQVFLAVQASLCELLRKDNVVYHGQAGHLLLPGISHVLRVRLIAPRVKRVDLAMARDGLTRTEASKKIDQVDSERTRWTTAFFGVNWGDPLLFDLVLNLEVMSFEEACELIVNASQLPHFRTTPASQKKMEDLVLASRVSARLNTTPSTAGLALDVTADGGTVKLIGVTHGGDLEWVSRIVQKIEGVQAIELTDRVT